MYLQNLKGVVVYDFFITMSNMYLQDINAVVLYYLFDTMPYLYLQNSKENDSLFINLLLHFMDWFFFAKIKIISKKMYLRNKSKLLD